MARASDSFGDKRGHQTPPGREHHTHPEPSQTEPFGRPGSARDGGARRLPRASDFGSVARSQRLTFGVADGNPQAPPRARTPIWTLIDPVSCVSCVSWWYSVNAAETHETIHTESGMRYHPHTTISSGPKQLDRYILWYLRCSALAALNVTDPVIPVIPAPIGWASLTPAAGQRLGSILTFEPTEFPN